VAGRGAIQGGDTGLVSGQSRYGRGGRDSRCHWLCGRDSRNWWCDRLGGGTGGFVPYGGTAEVVGTSRRRAQRGTFRRRAERSISVVAAARSPSAHRVGGRSTVFGALRHDRWNDRVGGRAARADFFHSVAQQYWAAALRHDPTGRHRGRWQWRHDPIGRHRGRWPQRHACNGRHRGRWPRRHGEHSGVGGSVGGTTCPGLAPNEELIDDMNDGDRFIPQVNGRAGLGRTATTALRAQPCS